MSTASSQQLSAVSRQIEQSRDLNRQLLNTIRWELQKVKAQTERLQGLHGKVDEVHAILKRLEAHQYGIQPLSSIHRFREQHSQTPPKSPTSEAGTQFNDQDGKPDFKPDEEDVHEYEKSVAEDLANGRFWFRGSFVGPFTETGEKEKEEETEL